ncbi:MAG: MgtC/SapB family protein [Bacteroidales bacterium]|nr:MgtC/SapB family protein [Bacteroidales bacterium]
MTWNFILRLFIAGLLGGLIGIEREYRAKEAGIRTHFIVALGSALFMIISEYAFSGNYDHSRVAAQVVSGIGFIGAGVIIFQKNAVRGITTAAGLWVAAAIGLSCGAEMYLVAAGASLMTIICLETMHFVNIKYGTKVLSVSVSPVDNEGAVKVIETLKSAGIKIEAFSVTYGKVNLRIQSTQGTSLDKAKTVLSLLEGFKVDIS